MIVSNIQLTQSFTASTQMVLTNLQRSILFTEGLVTINDFVDFNEDDLNIVFKNVRSRMSCFLCIYLVSDIL